MLPPRARLTAVALVLVAGACSASTAADDGTVPSTTTPAGPVDGPLAAGRDAVFVIGDSLTNGARRFGDLGLRLRDAGFEDVAIVAEDGRELSWALDEVEERDVVAPVVVVELGTNPSAAVSGFADDVVALVDALRARGAERIAWLTPAHGRDDRYEGKADVLATTPGVDLVADWAALVRDDPRRRAADGLHPTEAGYTDLAAFMTEAAVDVAGG